MWRLWPAIEEYRAEDEEHVLSWMRSIPTFENYILINDQDGNGVKDYWTGDVTGVWNNSRYWIPLDVVAADAAPLYPPASGPTPFHGYYYISMERDKSCKPPEEYHQDTADSGRNTHNRSRFGFCAYPVTYNWRHRRTFIVNEGGVVFSVDSGGKPVTAWPTDSELNERFRPEDFPGIDQ